MIRINRQRIETWLRRPKRAELSDLSDRTLQDIGLSRCERRSEACKAFWMA